MPHALFVRACTQRHNRKLRQAASREPYKRSVCRIFAVPEGFGPEGRSGGATARRADYEADNAGAEAEVCASGADAEDAGTAFVSTMPCAGVVVDTAGAGVASASLEDILDVIANPATSTLKASATGTKIFSNRPPLSRSGVVATRSRASAVN